MKTYFLSSILSFKERSGRGIVQGRNMSEEFQKKKTSESV